LRRNFTVKIKHTVYLNLVLLIASFATVQQAIAQVPCGGTIIPNATLFVNWPQFQYDAAHTGCNPYESILKPSNVANLRQKWVQSAGNQGGYSSAVVANGVVYTSLTIGSPLWYSYLEGYSANTGAPLWGYLGTPALGFAAPAVVNGVVYAGSADYNLYALDARTSTLLWKYATGGAVTTPTIANGVVYAGSADNNVYAVNATTGALLWQYATGGPMYAAPAVANGVVYIGSDDHNLYALNASTGALLWKYATSGYLEASPSVANGKVYLPADQLYALNATTGALVWQSPATSDSPVAISRGVVYVGSGSNVYALNGSTGDVLWQYQVSTFTTSAPVVSNGVVYVGCLLDIRALDAGTGTLLFLSSGSQFYSSPVVANGVVYISTSPTFGDGQLYAYSINGQ
jgi:eukaryotic-like serine/threonine-protein kinase